VCVVKTTGTAQMRKQALPSYASCLATTRDGVTTWTIRPRDTTKRGHGINDNQRQSELSKIQAELLVKNIRQPNR